MNIATLPEVSFAQKDITVILTEMISAYEQAYYNQTGQQITLYPGDPIRIFIYSQALREFQLRQLIDFSAKQNLLKYASGEYLDNFCAPFVERMKATKAKVSEKFTLSSPKSTIQIISKGTRVSAGSVFFQTTEDVQIPIGDTEVICTLECLMAGTKGNNFTPGQINVLVDPLPWIASVTNIDTSQGGAETEDDESLRERMQQAPEGFSTAGPEGAYIFFAKQFNSAISDVKVKSPTPGAIDIRVLLDDGQLPSETFINELQEYLSDKNRRPLTDNVTVNVPSTANYNLELTYYITSDNVGKVLDIQNKVNSAVQGYITWQKSKIGRDINPSELIARLITAGAKRVVLTSPVYTAVSDTQVAIASGVNVTYGGLEND